MYLNHCVALPATPMARAIRAVFIAMPLLSPLAVHAAAAAAAAAAATAAATAAAATATAAAAATIAAAATATATATNPTAAVPRRARVT